MSTRIIAPSDVMRILRKSFRAHLGGHGSNPLLPPSMLYDKAYEISCMLQTMTLMQQQMGGLRYVLSVGSTLRFRAKGGPIVRSSWPFIQVYQGTRIVAEIWTDIEFLALSAWLKGELITSFPYGKAHELDIVIVRPDVGGRPKPDDIFIGVEAKHRPFNKSLLKELLGVRREMCFYNDTFADNNEFTWCSHTIPARPASGLLLFCSNQNVSRYNDPEDFWGIQMLHHMP